MDVGMLWCLWRLLWPQLQLHTQRRGSHRIADLGSGLTASLLYRGRVCGIHDAKRWQEHTQCEVAAQRQTRVKMPSQTQASLETG